jgi:hypothetical protein
MQLVHKPLEDGEVQIVVRIKEHNGITVSIEDTKGPIQSSFHQTNDPEEALHSALENLSKQ